MDFKNLVKFYDEINKLKDTKRFGNYGLEYSESTSDHIWKMIFLAIDLNAKLNLDVDMLKLIRILTVQELPEYSLTVNVDAHDLVSGKISKEEKINREDKTMQELCKKYDSMYIYELWKEYQDQETKEAKMANAISKLETLTHIINRAKSLKNFEFTVKYCDQAILKVQELSNVLTEIKLNLKKYAIENEYEWNKDWETSHII